MIPQRKHILKAQPETTVHRSTANPESDRVTPRKTDREGTLLGPTLRISPRVCGRKLERQSETENPSYREPAAPTQHRGHVPSPLWAKALRFSLGKSLVLSPHSGFKHLYTAPGKSKLAQVGTFWNMSSNFVTC